MRGIHFVLAIVLAMSFLPAAEAAADATIRLSNLCRGTPNGGPNFDALDPVLPDGAEGVPEHFEDINFWCSNSIRDIEIDL